MTEVIMMNYTSMDEDDVMNTSSSLWTTRGNITFLKSELSMYMDPLSVAIPMTLIYSLILILGLVGNVSTCIVIWRTNYMHTSTNYYLFSLALSDLLLLLSGVPQEIYHIWIKFPYVFGQTFCLIRGLAAETSANATVLTITAFTVERFVAIVYPLKGHLLSQLSRVVKMIAVIWIVALCFAIPQATQFGVQDLHSAYPPFPVLIKGAWCAFLKEHIPYGFHISTLVFFIIPMTIITVLYILIGIQLRKASRKPMTAGGDNTRSHTNVIRMLIAVVIGFFCCWAPFHTQRLLALYATSVGRDKLSLGFKKFFRGLTHISGVLYYLSTCINPILYNILSLKFRQAFKDSIMRPLCRGGEDNTDYYLTPHHRQYSASAMSLRSLRLKKAESCNSIRSVGRTGGGNGNNGGNCYLPTIEEAVGGNQGRGDRSGTARTNNYPKQQGESRY